MPICAVKPLALGIGNVKEAGEMAKPKAIISVYDKSGVVEFAQALRDLGFEILSTGGTAAELSGAGIPVTPVSEVTGLSLIHI